MVRSIFAVGFAVLLLVAHPVQAQQPADKEELNRLRAEVEKLRQQVKQLEAEKARGMAEPPRNDNRKAIVIRRGNLGIDLEQIRRLANNRAGKLDPVKQLAEILANSNIDLEAVMKLVEQQRAGRNNNNKDQQPKLPTDPA